MLALHNGQKLNDLVIACIAPPGRLQQNDNLHITFIKVEGIYTIINYLEQSELSLLTFSDFQFIVNIIALTVLVIIY